MKRLLVTALAVCMLCTGICTAGTASVFDDIGGWLSQAGEDVSKWVSQAADDVSKWVEQAWKDAPAWIENAWGDASKWIEQAWGDSAKWAEGIWGDVSAWATKTYNTASGQVSAWWNETFNTVTATTRNAWDWLAKEKEALIPMLSEKYGEIRKAAEDGLASAGEKLSGIFAELLKVLKLNDADVSKVMQTISAYAESKGISLYSIEMAMLPYIAQLALDSGLYENADMPAVAVAQYLIGIFEKNGIGTEAQVQELIDSLAETLNAQ